MVFQNPDNQIVANVVREDVAFGLENLGVPQDEMVRRVEAALSAVRMSEFAETAPHMLSGGQKQRVAIAGALAMEPELIIMDEATAMLDPSGRAEVLATVRKLNREKGMTVVWITHFMEEAARGRPAGSHERRFRGDGRHAPAGVLPGGGDQGTWAGRAAHGRTGPDPAGQGTASPGRDSHRQRHGKGAEKRTMPIQVEHLTHTYMTDSPFAATALEDVSLTIEDGELIGLLGHTGSGKTTLVQHLNGLLKPTSGRVVVDGLDITEKDVSLLEVRRRVGLVFQYPEYQLFEETVAKDVAFGPKNLGLSEQEVDERVALCPAGSGARLRGYCGAVALRTQRRPDAPGGHRGRAGHAALKR